jgi:hypothetical protein
VTTTIVPSPPRENGGGGRELAPRGMQLKEVAFTYLLFACLVVAVIFLIVLL